ncbi:MAG: type II toxin-antitoxin system VapC family toxin [Planctomycetota bacterium]
MKLLLDTHAILWFWWDDPQLGSQAREAITKAGNQKMVSIATPWEVAIKVSLKKLDLGGPFPGFFRQSMQRSFFEWLPLEDRHFEVLVALPFHHRDPFDRLLIAQALADDIPIVSREAIFDAYGVRRVW